MHRLKYITKLSHVDGLENGDREQLQRVTDRFAFRANEYYLSLIDWDDPDDPIRRVVLPDIRELEPWGDLDASGERLYKKAPNLEHKYKTVALILVTRICGAYCRFCFRKRLFMNDNHEVERDFTRAFEYIEQHKEITNVLLSGGDPLILSTNKLGRIIERLRQIDHVKIIRIGTKLPVFNPYRIVNDPSLLEMLNKYSTAEKRIYVVVHFNHPRELTDQAIEGMDLLQKAGVITVNQTPLIAGVNDDPKILADLFTRLSFCGIAPYYIFQCRPTLGNKTYAVPLEKGYEIVEEAKARCSGLAKRSRYVMSHQTGKIEIVGLTERNIFFKYHRSATPGECGRFLVYRRNPDAFWFDDYTMLENESNVGNLLQYHEAE
jgi:lysine 2,3-aminomutase